MADHRNDFPDIPYLDPGVPRYSLPVVLAVVGLVAALVILLVFIHPAAGAAGGCGGG
jgi:hypothetical protein